MEDISKKDLDALFKNVKKNSVALIFSISLKDFKKQSIFFEDDDRELYTIGIENHISKISKKRFLKISDNEYIFVVIQNDSKIEDIEKRVLSELYKSIQIGKYLISIPYSIGSSKYPKDSSNFFKCTKFARVSKYYQSRTSIKYYSKYSKENYDLSHEEFIIKNTLISALENDFINLVYQPVYDSDKKEILYFEALLRWKNEDVYFSPQKIIEISESNETIHLLTEYIFEKACVFQSDLKKLYNDKIKPISVNISQSALANPKLPWKLSSLIKKYALDFKDIKLEITETTSSKKFSSIEDKNITSRDISKKLINLGFELYADDFGVGFSNLEFLSSHDFLGIKLDKYFIDMISMDNSNYFLSLIKCILSFANENNQIIICEGIETSEQLELIKSLGFPFYVQGYLFSKPISEKKVKEIYLGI